MSIGTGTITNSVGSLSQSAGSGLVSILQSGGGNGGNGGMDQLAGGRGMGGRGMAGRGMGGRGMGGRGSSNTPQLEDDENSNIKYVETTIFTSGNLNPFSKRLSISHITINSVLRPDYHTTRSTDFLIELPDPLTRVAAYEVTSFCVVPVFYNINSDSNSNKMMITLENLPNNIANNQKIIEVEDGVYQPNDIVNFFNGIFSASSYGLQFLRCDYNNTARRLSFRPYNFWTDGYLTQLVNGNIVLGGGPFNETIINPASPTSLIPNPFYSPTCRFILDFTTENIPPRPAYTTLGWVLGFTYSVYELSMDTYYTTYNKAYFNFYNRFSTSLGPTFLPGYTNNLYLQKYFDIDTSFINIYGYVQGENLFVDRSTIANSGIYVYLDVDDFNKNYSTTETIAFGENFDSTFSSTTLCKINISTTLVTVDNNPNRLFFGPVDIKKMRVRLLNRFGQVMDIHNDYAFTLRVTSIY